jgi:sugar transferase (PEP-CTERM/EpsH1 system associated)
MNRNQSILYLTSYAPSTERPRAYNILRGLARHFRISLVAQVRSGRERFSAERMEKHCERIKTVWLPRWRAWLNCLMALPTRTPLRAAYFRNPAMKSAIHRRMREEEFDLIHVEHMMAAHFAADLQHRLRSFDALDSITRLQEKILQHTNSQVQRLISREELPKLRRYEPLLCRRFDCVLTSTELDREALGVGNVRVVPNGVDLDYYQPRHVNPDSNTVLFYGRLSYVANVDAIGWFLREIFPRIVARRPSARLLIVGPSAPPFVMRAASHNITVAGHVEDVRPYLRRPCAVVCPVRFAVGTQNKVLEPMAMGVPVLATTEAIASLSAEPEKHLLVADDPDAFAEQAVRLFDDEALRATLAQQGREYVEAHHDWNRICDDLAGFYREKIESRIRTAP